MTRGVKAEPITDLNDVRNESWHGYFDREGCWRKGASERFAKAASGSMTRGVRELVWLRRNTVLSPQRAAMLIEVHGLSGGFPLRNLWADQPDAAMWPVMPAATSAEAAVKHSGMGVIAPTHTWGTAGAQVNPQGYLGIDWESPQEEPELEVEAPW